MLSNNLTAQAIDQDMDNSNNFVSKTFQSAGKDNKEENTGERYCICPKDIV